MAAKSYDKAIEELRLILEQLQEENVSIDKLAAKVKKASELINFCKDRLRSVEEELTPTED